MLSTYLESGTSKALEKCEEDVEDAVVSKCAVTLLMQEKTSDIGQFACAHGERTGRS